MEVQFLSKHFRANWCFRQALRLKMKIKLGGLLLDQAATLLQPPAMNLELRKMRWNGGECCGLAPCYPMAAFIGWLGIKNKLTTRERLAQWGYTRGCLCVFWRDFIAIQTTTQTATQNWERERELLSRDERVKRWRQEIFFH